MRLGDKGYLQFMFPSERHFKSFGYMAEMIGREFAFGVIFLSLSDSMHIVICACEKVRECPICIRRVKVTQKIQSLTNLFPVKGNCVTHMMRPY